MIYFWALRWYISYHITSSHILFQKSSKQCGFSPPFQGAGHKERVRKEEEEVGHRELRTCIALPWPGSLDLVGEVSLRPCTNRSFYHFEIGTFLWKYSEYRTSTPRSDVAHFVYWSNGRSGVLTEDKVILMLYVETVFPTTWFLPRGSYHVVPTT